MKKITFVCIAAYSISCFQPVQAAPLTENVKQTIQKFLTMIHSYFQKPITQSKPSEVKPLIFAPPKEIDPATLSPFQTFFRHTITFANYGKDMLSKAALAVIEKGKQGMLSTKQAGDQFIADLEKSGKYFIKHALQETLDVNLDQLVPSIEKVEEYIGRLQKAIEPLQHVRLIGQIETLIEYAQTVKQNALDLQHAGIIKVSAALAASSLIGYEQELAVKFKQLYHVYPTLIEEINNLKIAGPGIITQSIFNRVSELIEHVINLHSSTGKIGKILVQNDLINPLDTVKNQARKLGNAIDFTTRIKPVIVVAPPTTYAALIEILKTFIWRDGTNLVPIVMEDMEKIAELLKSLERKIQPLIKKLQALQTIASTIPDRIQEQFIAAIKANPLLNIPTAPLLLREILEENIHTIKLQLNSALSKSVSIISELSLMLKTSAHLLPYINEFMGATEDEPFVNPEIIRGIGFIAQDSKDISETMLKIKEGLANFSVLGLE